MEELLSWKRPPQPPAPALWARHEVDGVSYRVQEATPDMHAEILDKYVEEYMEDEPQSAWLGTKAEEVSCAEYSALFAAALAQGVSLVVLEERPDAQPPRLVGGMILPVLCKDDPDLPAMEGVAMNKMLGLYETLRGRPGADPLHESRVSVAMFDLGLWVSRDRRGRGLATAILRELPNVCRAFRIPHFSTPFTGAASQAICRKLGFYKELSRQEYEVYRDAEGRTPFAGIKEKHVIVMGFDVDLET